MITKVRWSRYGNGYEVSSFGDKRFSALYAMLEDGRSIEQHYQGDVKGYDPGGRNWKLGKGKPPLDKTVDLWTEYLRLWSRWSKLNPKLIEELNGIVSLCDNLLTDRYATTGISQAAALAEILNSTYRNI